MYVSCIYHLWMDMDGGSGHLVSLVLVGGLHFSHMNNTFAIHSEIKYYRVKTIINHPFGNGFIQSIYGKICDGLLCFNIEPFLGGYSRFTIP